MPTSDGYDDLLTFAFSLQSNPGAYAVLVGAGISKPIVPTAWEVLTQLIVDFAAVRGSEISVDDAEAWWIDTFGTDASYETVLKTLGRTQIERQRLMRRFFEPDAGDPDAPPVNDVEPTLAHRSIARLVKLGVLKAIITINFDHLLERALRTEGIEPTIVTTESDVRGLAPLHTLDCCLIHLHGDYVYPETMLNTKTELQSYKPVVQKLLQQVIEQYGLIISGWSAQYDPALREAIKAGYSSRLTMLWMNPSESLSSEATSLVTLKDAMCLRATAEEGFGRLAEAVESMRTRRARHPLTVSTAAETAAGRRVIPLPAFAIAALTERRNLPYLGSNRSSSRPRAGHCATPTTSPGSGAESATNLVFRTSARTASARWSRRSSTMPASRRESVPTI